MDDRVRHPVRASGACGVIVGRLSCDSILSLVFADRSCWCAVLRRVATAACACCWLIGWLVGALVVWQDKEDDARVGLKSTALTLGDRTVPVLNAMSAASCAAFALTGAGARVCVGRGYPHGLLAHGSSVVVVVAAVVVVVAVWCCVIPCQATLWRLLGRTMQVWERQRRTCCGRLTLPAWTTA